MSKSHKISFITIIISCFLIVFLDSCKVGKRLIANRQQHLTRLSENEIQNLVKSHKFDFNTISAKCSVECNLDSNLSSFNVSLRGRKDSILWFSITAPIIGIEAARAIITKDSVLFMDRIHNKYFAGNYTMINKLLHADLDFELIQNLFVGNNVEFYDDADRLHSGVDDGRYFLSTIRKRKMRKVMEHNKELKDPAQFIWLDPVTYKTVRLVFKDFNANRSFEANYDKFEMIDSMLFPHNLHFNIKAEKNIDIHVDYSKVTINTKQRFPFSIPSKYERIATRE